jgi:hypothetical protein
MIPIFEKMFATKKQEEPKQEIKEVEEVIVPLGDTVFWTFNKSTEGRPIPSSMKWAWMNKADYSKKGVWIGKETKITGTSHFIKDKFSSKTYDPELLNYLVKDADIDKLDTYIQVWIEHGFNLKGYVKNTDNYFKLLSKEPNIYQIGQVRKGLPLEAKEIPREEAEKFLYKATEPHIIYQGLFSSLYKISKNSFVIKTIDHENRYIINTFEDYKKFKQALEYYELPQNNNYYE